MCGWYVETSFLQTYEKGIIVLLRDQPDVTLQRSVTKTVTVTKLMTLVSVLYTPRIQDHLTQGYTV